ncbi:hypothetical protein [Legionella sainthelensi]|uniref:hypothetical protein n=1 Tax=Legionella sainthelensi TaxID=28087 RepID=UPI00286A9626|nr:hypothetical protein [Legionella sainthelensi]
MRYGQVDANGKRHGRHALRIDKIIPNANSTGGYDFVLVNPWDNQKRETYSLKDIQQKKCRFSTFTINPYEHDLKQKLLQFPEKNRKKSICDVKLDQMLLHKTI